MVNFVNADLIAAGLAPLRPEMAALSAARILLRGQGGHDVPKADVLRRFHRSEENFEAIYKALADAWTVYNNAGARPVLIDRGP